MRRIAIVLLVPTVLMACTAAEEPPTAGERAIEETKALLPDDDLVAAIPPGVELDRIVRNDLLFQRERWITVGVRLQPEDISFARAVFYVLPNEAAARRLYRQQSGRLPGAYRTFVTRIDERAPRPFSVGKVKQPNLCGLGDAENLWVCHATAGRLYLLTQSASADKLWPADFEPGTERYARIVFTAFARLLDGS